MFGIYQWTEDKISWQLPLWKEPANWNHACPSPQVLVKEAAVTFSLSWLTISVFLEKPRDDETVTKIRRMDNWYHFRALFIYFFLKRQYPLKNIVGKWSVQLKLWVIQDQGEMNLTLNYLKKENHFTIELLIS